MLESQGLDLGFLGGLSFRESFLVFLGGWDLQKSGFFEFATTGLRVEKELGATLFEGELSEGYVFFLRVLEQLGQCGSSDPRHRFGGSRSFPLLFTHSTLADIYLEHLTTVFLLVVWSSVHLFQ